jgi:SpoIIAA-like
MIDRIADMLKADLGLGLGHLSAWERMAIVSDESWMRHLMAGFGWMVPGELKLFSLGEMDAAKEWLAR